MVEIYGAHQTRKSLAALGGSLSQFAGVRLMTLGDGLERGIRMLEFNSGSGLRFSVMVDRAMDIADCSFHGMAIGWHSPSGFRHPGLHDYEGEGGLGWLRSFSGLLVTCGLDHILFMESETAEHYNYGPRKTVNHSIHGRVSTIPAKLSGYGERWDGDDCYLWCEGSVIQATVFGENLEMIRRIEIKVGTNDIQLSDRVVNRGFYKTPHMLMYHINVGHPVLAEGARYLAPLKEVLWASHDGPDYRKQNVGYQRMPAPQPHFYEQVWEHDMAADPAGEVSVALVNDALQIGFEVTTRKEQFPCTFEWQNLQAGQYVVGLEPSTNHVQGRAYAKQHEQLIWLEHGDERRYDTRLRILAGASEIAQAESRIRTVCVQPQEDYPSPTGHFPAMGGKS